MLFTTGYLTQVGMTEQGAYKLVIPNKEVREVYKLQIQDWFDKKVRDNTETAVEFLEFHRRGKYGGSRAVFEPDSQQFN